MATTVVSTIGSAGGRDYSTIAAWEDDTDNTSLTAADEIREGHCYNDSEFLVTASIALAGATTDATRYRRLTAATGQSFADHADKLTNPLTYDVSKGAGIKTTTDYLELVVVSEANFRVDRLQIYNTKSGSGSARRGMAVSASGVTVRNMIVKTGGCQVVNVSNTANIINSALISDDPNNNGLAFNVPATCGAFNVTIVCPSDATVGTANGVLTSNANMILQNCAVFGAWTNRFSGTFNASSGFNATDHSSAPGSNNQVSLTYSDQFEAVTTAGQDFRAKASGSLDNGTQDTSNTSDLDIVGQTRPASTPTIGAWEANPAGGGGATKRRYSLTTLGVG